MKTSVNEYRIINKIFPTIQFCEKKYPLIMNEAIHLNK